MLLSSALVGKKIKVKSKDGLTKQDKFCQRKKS